MADTTPTNHAEAVHYVEHGSGIPVVILHGAYSYHHEVEAALEPVFEHYSGYRRIYPDLPGMGHTPAPESVASVNDVVKVMLEFVDAVVGDSPFLLIGHSFGGYIGRGIVARRPECVMGLALLCPFMSVEGPVAEQVALDADPAIEGRLSPEQNEEFRGYFVIQNEETLARYVEAVAPAGALVDHAAQERMSERWEITPSPEAGDAYLAPTVIVVGRHDSTVGYTDQWALVDHYPRANFVLLERAGHALPHEQPELVKVLLGDWLARVRKYVERST